jgi:hypothetical protein
MLSREAIGEMIVAGERFAAGRLRDVRGEVGSEGESDEADSEVGGIAEAIKR